ncbi:HAMP domain-containing histidine kinase [Frisingicoccus caecimuris]|uniref:histidine kinase n=1 Tax=Frisingicoccus caecimuris TaxID=1796636 RepID=A0A4R2LGY4_9FIRM|nr:HAMP domain-containing sensor histidine kinase [Frisingicoccus caecimuris]MCR1919399.1 HAMP domain-containing histidine kinase [Frisingicoccus caecimuris]TCO84111.1 signal transduction histidine kinase [Frisingicoccus caecimuris]
MGVKKKPTLKILFRQFAIFLIVVLAAAIIVPFALESLAVNAGLATRANQSELQVKEIIPTLTIAPDITKVVIPQGCGYLILDKNFNELYSNMDDDEKEIALLYAKGEYIEYATGRQFALVVRENEFCVLRYYIDSQFTVSWLPDFFPSPDTLTFILMGVNSLLVIIVLTARFAKNLRTQLTPLFEATTEVAKQNLDFEVGHSKIKEFEDVLASFSDMKDNLKISLERQWKTEQTQKDQIVALAHDLKTPLTVIQGNADLIIETELNEEQRLYAEYISSSSEQMQLYIRTLIDISRAAVGYQLHMVDIDLPAFAEQLRGQIDALCQTKKIGLQMETRHLPDTLSADPLLLERAIMNVVSNALDYSPRDGCVYITIMGVQQNLQISVADAGSGFSQEDLLHAQEQFYMADRSRSSKLHFGMGLFITKSIVQQHNGQLILGNSEKTGGAQVTIKIPISG